MIEKGLLTHLKADTPTVALVADRIWAILAPYDVSQPYITYQKISEPEDYHHGGRSMFRPRIQINCYSTTYLDVKNLETAVRNALAGYTGTYDSKTVYSAFIDNAIDGYETETKKYSVIIDVLFQYEED